MAKFSQEYHKNRSRTNYQPTRTVTEEQIIKGCKRIDRKAQRAFVDEYSAFIFSICYRYMGNHEMAKDALQECLVQVISNIGRYEDIGRFKSWVGSVCVRKCLDILRKEKRHRHGDVDSAPEPFENSVANLNLEFEDVKVFLENIPEKYRIALNMFLVEGYSHKEIGEHLDINESSSRSLISRGRKMIKEAFLKQKRMEESKLLKRDRGDYGHLSII